MLVVVIEIQLVMLLYVLVEHVTVFPPLCVHHTVCNVWPLPESIKRELSNARVATVARRPADGRKLTATRSYSVPEHFETELKYLQAGACATSIRSRFQFGGERIPMVKASKKDNQLFITYWGVPNRLASCRRGKRDRDPHLVPRTCDVL
ncbi:hypothetical protein Trydic_g15799 [Trypoxylus dichotomus]